MSHFGHSHRSSNFFIVFVRVICVWSVISDGTVAKNTYNLLKAQIMVSILLAIKFLFLPFFFGCTCGMWKFLGQGSNPCHSSDNTGSLTRYAPHENNCVYLNLKRSSWSSHCGALETNLTSNLEVLGSIPGLTQWVKDLVLP